jgi:competence ComEA-like helix-hairpin-helix protein
MRKSIVRINQADAKSLQKIYGIGPGLAARIIDYRERKGPFRSAVDLAKVAGIGAQRAEALSHQIDWTIPPKPASTRPLPLHDRLVALAPLLVLTALCLFILSRLLMALISAYFSQEDDAWLSMWMYFVAILLNVVALSTAPSGYKYLWRGGHSFYEPLDRSDIIAFPILLGGVVLLIINRILYYAIYAPEGWVGMVRSPYQLAGLFAGALALAVMGPITLIIYFPQYMLQRWVVKCVDSIVVLYTVFIAVVVWMFRNEIAVWILIIFVFMGYETGVTGIKIIRGESLYLNAITSLQQKTDSTQQWLTWLNARLPDRSQQVQLLAALKQAYPPSPFRTLGGIIVVTSASWLLVTALGGVIEWFVQKWLESVVR